jgi:hypothetical protein
MIPNLRFYVISIVSIFLALGIGIYIGFTLDAQNVLIEQKEDIANKLEEQFNYLKSENANLKKETDELNVINMQYKRFSEAVYPEIIKDRLSGMKVAIIETNDDYVYSAIGQSLEMSGANVTSITTIKDNFLDEEILKKAYLGINDHNEKNLDESIISKAVNDVIDSLITGEEKSIINNFKTHKIINIIGNYDEPVDFIIIAGGSNKDDLNRIKILDKVIIENIKAFEIPIVGIEKEKVKYSYIDEFKDSRISTIDNVDSIIGKISLIMVMEGRSGNYGVKANAEELMPDFNHITTE